ncbi:hypothetical protein P9D39_22885 [Heyndrickxia oleronia]|jgi:hypothetical protein|uniref:Uncharacterized protein n=1 Tax=Heyndrickxia oleronia TaxID=38875 RepID=A0A8E2IF46_9BACI|nr:hypothetical protein [Heyndrickxia oleronia]MBU5213057.1 hypothetical protein [Heyndrickxia oleronia]MEC1377129.1 hypothetical protein [Heyndrickxia oleronia]OOP69935.1 hypothetical protein BWZ43_02550 [Heyndrickxia oleronia]QQZ05822.1 hypothetical protein I5818_05005 [Heyndrickxia oleronia]
MLDLLKFFGPIVYTLLINLIMDSKQVFMGAIIPTSATLKIMWMPLLLLLYKKSLNTRYETLDKIGFKE